MRSSTNQLEQVVRGGSFDLDLTVDVFYGATRVMQDVPVVDWSFTADLDAEIPTSGKLIVAYQGDFADSIIPREASAALAPFGQRVIPYLTVNAGTFRERLQVGVFEISGVPSAQDTFVTRKGRRFVSGSVVEIQLLDLFRKVRRARFRSVENPKTSSAWDEIARLTGLPVTRTVADGTIATTTTYDRSRLTTVQILASVLAGRAVMRADGSVGIIPDVPGASVTTLQIGEEGVVLDVGYSLEGDVPNVVVGHFEDAAGNGFYCEAVTTNGPLAVGGPYGESVQDYPEQQRGLVDTFSAGQTAVTNHLTRLQTGTRARVPVSVLVDPRLELGDVVALQRSDRTLTGRVVKQAIAKDSPMDLTLEVITDVAVP